MNNKESNQGVNSITIEAQCAFTLKHEEKEENICQLLQSAVSSTAVSGLFAWPSQMQCNVSLQGPPAPPRILMQEVADFRVRCLFRFLFRTFATKPKKTKEWSDLSRMSDNGIKETKAVSTNLNVLFRSELHAAESGTIGIGMDSNRDILTQWEEISREVS
jgi:hypothetical protein